MKKTRNIPAVFVWLMIFVGITLISSLFIKPEEATQDNVRGFSEVIDLAHAKKIQSAELHDHMLTGTLTDGSTFSSYIPTTSVLDTLVQEKVQVTAYPADTESVSLKDLLIAYGPTLLFVVIFIIFMRQMMNSSGKALSFGKSRARLLTNQGKVTFADVAGIDEAKQELQEVVEFLKEPAKFQRLGGKIPKGVLLVGPPGTGKTLLARAIAGEANVPFFTISGSDFVEMFVGVGASRVRDMFEEAKKNAPCILFVDEIDAVGRQRGAGLGGGNDEREQTLNQLLVEMDGFETNSGIILLAATNRPDVLDPALLRPGRFDRQVTVPNPDVKGREEILAVHIKKVPQAPDVNIHTLARGTPGFSGADLANLINEAALLAARRNKFKVTMTDLEDAKDKVLMGTERRSIVMDEKEKKMTAYHEAGHAICSLHLPESDPLHKVTIIPRGRALGLTMQLPEKDKYSQSLTYLKTRLSILFGGRMAEELIFGKDNISTGASNDIQVATSIARRMVTEWGMSEKMGTVAYEEPENEVFLGHSITRRKQMSEKTATEVDNEIRKIIDAAYAQTKQVLTIYHQEVEILAQALIEFETLDGEDITQLLQGKRPEKKLTKPLAPRVSVPTVKAGKKPAVKKPTPRKKKASKNT